MYPGFSRWIVACYGGGTCDEDGGNATVLGDERTFEGGGPLSLDFGHKFFTHIVPQKIGNIVY